MLDLSKFPEKKEGQGKETGRAKVGKNVNLSKYLYPHIPFSSAPSNTFFTDRGASSGKASSARAAAGKFAQRGRAVVNIKDYDLSPWANEVLNRIQKNWAIPLELALSAKGEVGISVVIEKNGQLSSAEIVISSKAEMLDQAAFKALQSSSPFPVLPDDFPNKNLEVYFVFQYGD